MMKEKGITLIALVITIIVLLILAGVSIAMLVGNNGILNYATSAKQKTNEAQEKENIGIAFATAQISNNGYEKLNQHNLQNAINSQFGLGKAIVTDKGNGSFYINVIESSRIYYVSNTGEITKKDNPIKINTVEELKEFRTAVNNGNTYEGEYIILTADLTLDLDETWSPIGLFNCTDVEDINNKPFKGTFDGQGHEINGINIDTTDKAQGLFGFVMDGQVFNIGIGEKNKITGGNATAGVVGYLYMGGIVSNCYNKADINTTFGGGIVGCSYNNTKVLNCYNTGVITGTLNNVGGIVGYNNLSATVENSYNAGEIHGTSFVGGITGYSNRQSSVRSCCNTGNIRATGTNSGGIVGKNLENSILADSYNTGDILGDGERIGGIIGYNQDSETYNSYSNGKVTATNTAYAGGVCGDVHGNYIVNNNYYEENTVNMGNGNELKGVIVKTAEDMKTQEFLNLLGSSFKIENGKNDGYPILKWQ